mmetsp:Transcript_12959/g.28623  ORF Transcript_12959/g.28623 Transcript_12959/m.28623 type:complete len:222 (+) Transcript_12959:87-752(+)
MVNFPEEHRTSMWTWSGASGRGRRSTTCRATTGASMISGGHNRKQVAASRTPQRYRHPSAVPRTTTSSAAARAVADPVTASVQARAEEERRDRRAIVLVDSPSGEQLDTSTTARGGGSRMPRFSAGQRRSTERREWVGIGRTSAGVGEGKAVGVLFLVRLEGEGAVACSVSAGRDWRISSAAASASEARSTGPDVAEEFFCWLDGVETVFWSLPSSFLCSA